MLVGMSCWWNDLTNKLQQVAVTLVRQEEGLQQGGPTRVDPRKGLQLMTEEPQLGRPQNVDYVVLKVFEVIV